MRWWGKAAGGTVGFAVLGPVGAVIGAVLGHGFDRGLATELDAPRPRGRAYPFREALLEATFSVMGHIAALDGGVTAAHRRSVGALIAELELEPLRQRGAWRALEAGTRPDFRLDAQLGRLVEICRGRPRLLRAFLDMQMRVALAGGGISGNTRVALRQICRRLGISAVELAQSEALARVRAGMARAASVVSEGDERVRRACGVLGVGPEADDDDVKRAYRRLMNRHHPDKLVGHGLDDDAMRAARERTHEIRAAYETVMQSRRS